MKSEHVKRDEIVLDARWFTECRNEDEKEQVRRNVAAALPVLRKLLEFVDREKREAEKPFAATDYTNPAWPYMTADKIGYVRGLTKIMDYIPRPR